MWRSKGGIMETVKLETVLENEAEAEKGNVKLNRFFDEEKLEGLNFSFAKLMRFSVFGSYYYMRKKGDVM
jgi:hypothetical protein